VSSYSSVASGSKLTEFNARKTINVTHSYITTVTAALVSAQINMAGGHGGSSGRYDILRERAFRYAFMLDAVGMANRLNP